MNESYGDPKSSHAGGLYTRGVGNMTGFGTSGGGWRGTQSSQRRIEEEAPVDAPSPLTSSGTPFVAGQSLPMRTEVRATPDDAVTRSSGEEFMQVRNLLSETRRFSGLKMDELASILRVSRRTLYNWRDGESPGEQNLQRLTEFRSLLDTIDRGFGVVNAMLLRETRDEHGTVCMELLKRGEWDIAAQLIGSETHRSRVSPVKLSDLTDEQREQVLPPSIGDRLDAVDSIDEGIGTEWLSELYNLLGSERIDDAMDLTVDTIDDCLRAGDFELVDRALRKLDVARLDTNLIVGWLAITKPARNKLLERSGFVVRVESRLKSIAPDRIEELIGGLR